MLNLRINKHSMTKNKIGWLTSKVKEIKKSIKSMITKKKNKRKGHGQVIAIKSEFKVSAGPSKSSESNEPKKKMCFMFWHWDIYVSKPFHLLVHLMLAKSMGWYVSREMSLFWYIRRIWIRLHLISSRSSTLIPMETKFVHEIPCDL